MYLAVIVNDGEVNVPVDKSPLELELHNPNPSKPETGPSFASAPGAGPDPKAVPVVTQPGP